MPPTNNFALRFWLLTLAAFIGVLWLFQPVLLPFLAGLAIAYFLEPAVTALEKHKVRRWIGALTVLSGFLFLVGTIILLISPMLNHQIGALINALPDYTTKIREHYLPWAQNWLARFSPEDVEKIRNAAAQSTGNAVGWLSQTVKQIVSGGFALVDAVALSILTPVTAFHALRDWGKLTKTVDELIPRRYYETVREQMTEIDLTLSGFIRGQAIVCVILGVIYSTGLSLNGLKYGATVGIVAGVLTIVPYVGTVFGWVTSVILACVQFDGDWLRIGLVVAVFAVGHFFEAYILTPRFVGNRVGLHPVWILFALIAGVKLMGFTGVLIAVPTAAVIGVLVRFGVRQYKASAMYQ
ncbi:MAG: AI-2E family transporter [Alphaproteobacteria bacterium]|nr:AI-2E family transporter [Alphaproteobacteria bacterium]